MPDPKPTVTGRLSRSEPEIQNLPGTPTHKLEMYFARHGVPKPDKNPK